MDFLPLSVLSQLWHMFTYFLIFWHNLLHFLNYWHTFSTFDTFFHVLAYFFVLSYFWHTFTCFGTHFFNYWNTFSYFLKNILFALKKTPKKTLFSSKIVEIYMARCPLLLSPADGHLHKVAKNYILETGWVGSSSYFFSLFPSCNWILLFL